MSVTTLPETTTQLISNEYNVDGTQNLDLTLLKNGVVVASCSLLRWDRPGATISMVHVPPPHRRKGHAFELLQEAIRKCEENGKTGVMLNVQRTNTSAQALYIKLGFRFVGVEYYYPDTLLMAKMLNTEFPEEVIQPIES